MRGITNVFTICCWWIWPDEINWGVIVVGIAQKEEKDAGFHSVEGNGRKDWNLCGTGDERAASFHLLCRQGAAVLGSVQRKFRCADVQMNNNSHRNGRGKGETVDLCKGRGLGRQRDRAESWLGGGGRCKALNIHQRVSFLGGY